MPKVKYTAEEQEIFKRAKEIKLCRRFGIEPMKTSKQFNAERRKYLKAKVKAVGRQKRQEIMDCFFVAASRKISVEEIADKCGVDWEVVWGTVQLNRVVKVYRDVHYRRDSL